MFLRKSICFTSILDVFCHNALFSLPPQELNGLSACSRHKQRDQMTCKHVILAPFSFKYEKLTNTHTRTNFHGQKKCAHYGAKIWGGGGICTRKSGCFRPFVLLHRWIARGERRRPRALKKITAVRWRSPQILRIDKAPCSRKALNLKQVKKSLARIYLSAFARFCFQTTDFLV